MFEIQLYWLYTNIVEVDTWFLYQWLQVRGVKHVANETKVYN